MPILPVGRRSCDHDSRKASARSGSAKCGTRPHQRARVCAGGNGRDSPPVRSSPRKGTATESSTCAPMTFDARKAVAEIETAGWIGQPAALEEREHGENALSPGAPVSGPADCDPPNHNQGLGAGRRVLAAPVGHLHHYKRNAVAFPASAGSAPGRVRQPQPAFFSFLAAAAASRSAAAALAL